MVINYNLHGNPSSELLRQAFKARLLGENHVENDTIKYNLKQILSEVAIN
jgi:hypothetical protein